MERLFSLQSAMFETSLFGKERFPLFADFNAAENAYKALDEVQKLKDLSKEKDEDQSKISDKDVTKAKEQLDSAKTHLGTDADLVKAHGDIVKEIDTLKNQAALTEGYTKAIAAMKEAIKSKTESQTKTSFEKTGNTTVDGVLSRTEASANGVAKEMNKPSFMEVIVKLFTLKGMDFWKYLGDVFSVGKKQKTADGREVMGSVAECKKPSDLVTLTVASEQKAKKLDATINDLSRKVDGDLPDAEKSSFNNQLKLAKAEKTLLVATKTEAEYRLSRLGYTKTNQIPTNIQAQKPYIVLGDQGTLLESKSTGLKMNETATNVWIQDRNEEPDTDKERLNHLNKTAQPGDLLFYQPKSSNGKQKIDFNGKGNPLDDLSNKKVTTGLFDTSVRIDAGKTNIDTTMKGATGEYLIVRGVDPSEANPSVDSPKAKIVAFGTIKPFEAEKK